MKILIEQWGDGGNSQEFLFTTLLSHSLSPILFLKIMKVNYQRQWLLYLRIENAKCEISILRVQRLWGLLNDGPIYYINSLVCLCVQVPKPRSWSSRSCPSGFRTSTDRRTGFFFFFFSFFFRPKLPSSTDRVLFLFFLFSFRPKLSSSFRLHFLRPNRPLLFLWQNRPGQTDGQTDVFAFFFVFIGFFVKFFSPSLKLTKMNKKNKK